MLDRSACRALSLCVLLSIPNIFLPFLSCKSHRESPTNSEKWRDYHRNQDFLGGRFGYFFVFLVRGRGKEGSVQAGGGGRFSLLTIWGGLSEEDGGGPGAARISARRRGVGGKRFFFGAEMPTKFLQAEKVRLRRYLNSSERGKFSRK